MSYWQTQMEEWMAQPESEEPALLLERIGDGIVEEMEFWERPSAHKLMEYLARGWAVKERVHAA